MAMTGRKPLGMRPVPGSLPRETPALPPVPMPEKVRDAVSLERLLAGDNARPGPADWHKLRAQSAHAHPSLFGCRLSAKARIPSDIRALAADPLVGPYARWAARQLEEVG